VESVLHFPNRGLAFVPLDGLQGPGQATIARPVTDAISPTLGAGLVRMTRGRIPWTVRYDEVIYVVDGELIIDHDGTSTVAGPGDVVFLREWTPIAYRTESQTTFFWALYPADWRTSRPVPSAG